MSSCVVEARSVTRDFRVAQKPSGSFSSLRHLVRRRYRTVRAVDGVSFSIHSGEVRKLSFGTRTKLELMAGLLHAPRVVFLDEPTVGVDQRTREALHDFLGSDAPDGLGGDAALVLTSHNLADITRIARRVLLIREGRLVYDGMLRDVVAASRESVRIKVRGRRLSDLPPGDARVIRDTADELELAVHPHAVRRVLAAVTRARDVRDVRTDVPSAEEALAELYRNLG